MDLSGFYDEYSLRIIFTAVLFQQLGAPIPVFPLLIFAGAQAVDYPMHGLWALVLSVLASAVGNYIWFLAGGRYGQRVVNAVCRVSLSPDSCVRQTETTFERYGPGTLVVARFLPGLGMVAPPLAGALRLKATTFLLYNGAGSALWAAGGLALGLVFHTQVEWLLESLASLGSHAMATVAGIAALYVSYRWWNRWRFRRALCAARISVAELDEMMNRGDEPLVLDVRSRTQRKLDGRSIPGARPIDLDDVERTLAEIPRDRDVIVYCACPNEATAATIAMQLQKRGILRVRPLAGGIDAWAMAGLKLEDRGTEP
jgi:membrane protein DedA with SNARE-associated domain/rhodanese-related sulfurtransferase